MSWPFIINRPYTRVEDIHIPFGGQRYGGIATPKDFPGIFLFTGHGAEKVGYGDRWDEDGSLHYTGEGQVGHMQMIKGNIAIRDHALNGKDLLVFRRDLRRGPHIFAGQFVCAGWKVETQEDSSGAPRDAFVFHLVPQDSQATAAIQAIDDTEPLPTDLQLLRQLAIDAAAPSGKVGEAIKSVYRRSGIVRDYVLKRANGICENCQAGAPFVTNSGRPFLEPHHIRRVSDGGPDDPRHMAGVCPNCHREAHHGVNAAELNRTLQAKIKVKEATI